MELINYTGLPDSVTRDRMVERAAQELRERDAQGVLVSGHMVAIDLQVGGGPYGTNREKAFMYTLRFLFGVAHGTLTHTIDASMKLSNKGDLKLGIPGISCGDTIPGERFIIDAGEVVWCITREPIVPHAAPGVAVEIFYRVNEILPKVHELLEIARR